jgi:hypothetical protein
MSNPFDKAVAICISTHSWGIRRKLNANELYMSKDGEEVSKESVSLSKALIKCDSYDAIKQCDGKYRKALEAISLPSILQRGAFLVPVGLLDEAERTLADYQKVRECYVNAFIDDYSHAIRIARDTLGPLFDESEYPSEEEVRGSFGVDVRYVSFSIPEKLSTINQAVYQREKAKLEQAMREATEEIRQAMRTGMRELVGHLADKLSAKREDGKPAIFRDSAVTNILDWMKLFEAKNLTDDAALAGLVSQARNVLAASGATVDDLRKDPYSRAYVAEEMGRIKEQLDGMVTSKPSRKFSFDEAA